MKKVVFLMFCVLCFCVNCQSQRSQQLPLVTADSAAFWKAKYQKILTLATGYEWYLVAYENQRMVMVDSIRMLTDSVVKLNNRPLMTKQQFLDLYKYERLLKYYKICKARPVNWKYYKGWSLRIFETAP